MKDISFWKWLALRHPEVRLTPMQRRWVSLLLGNISVLYRGPRASGRTFTLRLVAEYLKEVAE